MPLDVLPPRVLDAIYVESMADIFDPRSGFAALLLPVSCSGQNPPQAPKPQLRTTWMWMEPGSFHKWSLLRDS